MMMDDNFDDYETTSYSTLHDVSTDAKATAKYPVVSALAAMESTPASTRLRIFFKKGSVTVGDGPRQPHLHTSQREDLTSVIAGGGRGVRIMFPA